MPPSRSHRRAARRVRQLAAGLLPRLRRERQNISRRSLPYMVEEAVRVLLYLTALSQSGLHTMIHEVVENLIQAPAEQAEQPTPETEVSVATSDVPSPEEEICSVCLDRPVQVYLECNHNFCGQCPAQWQSVMPQGNNNLTCPVCRAGSADIYPIRDTEIDQILPITQQNLSLTTGTSYEFNDWNYPNAPLVPNDPELMHRHYRRASGWRDVNRDFRQCVHCGAQVSTRGLRTLTHERRCPGWT